MSASSEADAATRALEDRPMKIDRKPSRRQLLDVIAELQRLVGSARGHYWNDKGDRAENVIGKLDEAFNLAVSATRFDPPPVESGPSDGTSSSEDGP